LKISNGRVFLNAYKDVLIHIVLEFIAFVFDLSVWARSENILVYPTGLIAVIYGVSSFIAGLRYDD
jgi:hypothetical protein